MGRIELNFRLSVEIFPVLSHILQIVKGELGTCKKGVKGSELFANQPLYKCVAVFLSVGGWPVQCAGSAAQGTAIEGFRMISPRRSSPPRISLMSLFSRLLPSGRGKSPLLTTPEAVAERLILSVSLKSRRAEGSYVPKDPPRNIIFPPKGRILLPPAPGELKTGFAVLKEMLLRA